MRDMIQKLKHFAYHAKVIKRKKKLISKILSGYYKTLVLRENALRTIEFSLLAECNSKCQMCYASKIKKHDDEYLTVKEIAGIWQQASRLGAFSVILSGGEPTLRKDLFDILAVMDPENTIIALVTNSLNLNRSFLSDLKKAGIETIHLSLDSTTEEINDTIRGAKGHYKKVINSIEEAKSLGINVCLSTVIMHDGLPKMKEMVTFAKEHKIGIVFSLACVSGNWTDEKDVLLTPDEWQYVQQYMKENPHIRSDWTINFSMKQECPGGREKVSISPYGEVTGCAMNYVSFGNVRELPLETIWKRMCNFPDFKRRSRDCLIGADHRYIDTFIRPLSDSVVPVRIDKHPLNPIESTALDNR
ncbi:radical SAM protein [Candidatus Magnetomonas plexicatena]|uniref:radical SAM protein n=1 Tax=Candidatus Magnetomonas plexicatena TaxID=2552947 RepID=UPI0011043A2F|nr:radical SAM protein [Nitrospirales bacterium LBB_01]